MSAADCERWENRLLDLAYGEIEEAGEREVRAHLDGCEHCRRGLEKLERGRALARHLPQEDAPADAMQVVLRAARDKALEIEAARASAAASAALVKQEPARAAPEEAREPDAGGWWATVLSVVMAPQFAMATLLLLTVGVGLWWFPGGRNPSGPGTPLLSEPSELARGPEALAPADPIRFEVDPRTGHVEAHREGEPEERRVASADRRGIRGPRGPVEEEGTSSPAAAAATLHLADESGAGVVVDGVLPSTSPSAADSLAMGPASGVERAPATTPAIPTTPPVPEAPAAGMGPTSDRAPATSPPATSGHPIAARSIDEVEAPSPDGDVMVASAMLNQARELARTGHDRDAIARYESFLSRFRTSANAGAAMIELAELYRRTGALSRARSWLERATAIPSVAATARRELVRLDAAEREAPDHAASAEPSY